MRSKRLLVVSSLLVVAAAAAGSWALVASAGDPALDAARAATAQYHRIDVAKGDGYGLFTDAKGVACIDLPGAGAMGIHYVDGGLVGDPAIDASKPEALVYEPEQNGRLQVGNEGRGSAIAKSGSGSIDLHSAAPSSTVGGPIAIASPGTYSLHAWIWKHNPVGMFAPWNPDATCANA